MTAGIDADIFRFYLLCIRPESQVGWSHLQQQSPFIALWKLASFIGLWLQKICILSDFV